MQASTCSLFGCRYRSGRVAPPPKERPPTQKKLQIEAAALELFARKGFAGTSTKQIATAAGVAEGTIFRHFPPKKSLLLRICRPFVVEVVAPMASRGLESLVGADYDTLGDFLRALYADRRALTEAHPRTFRVLLQEASLHLELRELLREVFDRHARPHFERQFDALRDKGQLRRDVDDANLLRMIMATFLATAAFSDLVARSDATDQSQMLAMLEQALAPPP